MASTLANIRSTFKIRLYGLSRFKLLHSQSNFSDDSSNKRNLYESLGITPNATHNEIKKAYYDLTKKYHPDTGDSNDGIAATKFREITEAYEILGNFSLRKKYDRGVLLPHMQTVSAPIDHKVKYQEFYDSRMRDYNYDKTRYEEFESFQEKKKEEGPYGRMDVMDKPSTAYQFLIIAYFALIIILRLPYKRKY